MAERFAKVNEQEIRQVLDNITPKILHTCVCVMVQSYLLDNYYISCDGFNPGTVKRFLFAQGSRPATILER